jgi:hypothetical protein
MRLLVALLAIGGGCTQPGPADDAPCAEASAQIVEQRTFISDGSTSMFETTSARAEDLVIIAIAGERAEPPVASGLVAQVHAGGSCGSVTIWTAPVASDGSFRVTLAGGQPLVAAAAAVVRGLLASSGGHAYPYEHGWYTGGSAVAPKLTACPGDVVVSSIATCSSTSELVEPGFAELVSERGQQSTFALPDVAGKYGASWSLDPDTATTAATHTIVIRNHAP